MNVPKLGKTGAVSVVLSIAALTAAGAAPASASPGQGGGTTTVQATSSQSALSRQLLGQVGGGATYLEASAHTGGVYAIEYDITGTAFLDTYVNGVELGYVGGATGVYRTRSLTLSAGGHLVNVPGVEGSAMISAYLVQIS